jgi:mannosyl-3-phosphoglycerate phosphatase
MTKLLISTDLDGTLLDHHSYSYKAALPSLKRLKELNYPVIINTSKTFAEVCELQAELKLDAPFIVENGSAIYAQDTLELAGFEASEHPGYQCLKLGVERRAVVDTLHNLRIRHGWKFESYSDWTVEQVMDITGLERGGAESSLNREFSEPLIWSDSEEAFQAFSAYIQSAGLRIIFGGRFVHILGSSDKGKAISALQEQLGLNLQTKFQLVCLGDSRNDLDMLNIADCPIFIRSPVADFPEYSGLNTPIYSEKLGPEGWHETISNLLSQQQVLHSQEPHHG